MIFADRRVPSGSGLSTSRKQEALRALGRRRQRDRWAPYHCIADYHQGRYEFDAVSPYSKSAGNADADVFLLLQDWASDDLLRGPFHQALADFGHLPRLRTNMCLVRLLEQVFNLGLVDVYGTNLFPFVKPGTMSAGVPPRDLLRAAQNFAIPQIDIVQPRLVVCLGLATFNAIATALGYARPATLQAALASPIRHGTSRIWCQAHPAARGRSFQAHMAAWITMRASLGQ